MDTITRPYAFPHRLHIVDKRDFERAFKRGKRISLGYLVFVVYWNQLNHPRLGFVISKKNVKTSVMRQRFKRLVRELFRTHQSQLPNMDILVMVKLGATALNKTEQWGHFKQQWQNLIARLDSSQN